MVTLVTGCREATRKAFSTHWRGEPGSLVQSAALYCATVRKRDWTCSFRLPPCLCGGTGPHRTWSENGSLSLLQTDIQTIRRWTQGRSVNCCRGEERITGLISLWFSSEISIGEPAHENDLHYWSSSKDLQSRSANGIEVVRFRSSQRLPHSRKPGPTHSARTFDSLP